MKKTIRIFSAIVLSAFALSCTKKEEKTDKVSFNKGEITIVTDDSFKSVVEALAEAYTINYPETKVNVEIQKEDIAFLDLLKQKNRLIAISKPLTKEQIAEYEKQIDLKYHIDYFAADAVLFVVGKNSNRQSISMEEIKKELLSEEKNIIFDGTNSSNLNFIADKLGAKPSDLKYAIINGNENVVKELEKFPNKIGVISLNTISRPYAEKMVKLREMLKILPMEVNAEKVYPQGENLTQMKYPLTRLVYFLHNEGGFGMAKGIIRFSCTQLGQLVVEKEGLQPYNLYRREVEMR